MFLSLVGLSVALTGCRSARGPVEGVPAVGTVLYSNVGMHFDAHRGSNRAYSTNHIELATFKPAGTRFELVEQNRKYLTLRDEDGTDFHLYWVQKHSRMPMGEWVDRQFSTAPLELPAELSEKERAAIAAGKVEPGMSRTAVTLAVGYPPASLTPNLDADTWVYEARRFVSRRVTFDAEDRVSSYGR